MDQDFLSTIDGFPLFLVLLSQVVTVSPLSGIFRLLTRAKESKHKAQGRIHGHQLRTGGQGRKCAFPYFSTRVHGPPTNQRTDGRTKPLIELRVRN